MKINEVQNDKLIKKANKVLFNSVFGTVLPVIIGTTILVMFSKAENFISFIEDGTFCLITASLITSAMYLMDVNSELISEKWDRWLHLLSKPLWIIVATVFALIFAKEKLGIKTEINILFLWFISIVPFVIAILTLYRALIIDGRANPPSIDPKKVSNADVGIIIDNLK